MPKLNFTIFSYSSLKSENSFWKELIGSSSEFSMESRIFHSISICFILLASVYAPYNLYAGLYVGSVSAVIVALFLLHQYYYSRFRGKRHSNLFFGLLGVFIFGVNYFSNSGINGSTDLIWPVYLLLLFAISPYQQHFRWLVIYLVAFLLLHTLEFYYPSLVQYPFTAGKGQFIDRITAFPIPVIGLYIIIRYIRRNYDKERKIVEEKTIAIEKSKEQITLQRNQLEQSNTEKNKLMSIISHDIRTPLLNIQSYLELLHNQYLNGEERVMVEENLLKSTNSTLEMLSNMLYWSKSQMEGAQVKLVSANLFSVLEGTLEMQAIQAGKKNISLGYDIPNDIIVRADVDMLQLVIRNLISNAIKFTAEGGRIYVDAILESEQMCKITVSDNGRGIPREMQENVFSIKSEATSGTNNEKGVGLGLALCREFIEKQGGRIGFESTEGVGSRFFVFVLRNGSVG